MTQVQRLRAAVEPDDEQMARMTERFRARAEASGAIDVAYGFLDSPIGRLLVAASERGVVRVAFAEELVDEALDDVARRISARVLHAPRKVDGPRRQLDEYLAGTRRDFELAVDLAMADGFRRRVLDATAQIPYGNTLSYRDVARAAGNERAVRAAGTALASNPVPIVVPCHRVLRTGGGLGGYGGGLHRKRALLDLEAARVGDDA